MTKSLAASCQSHWQLLASIIKMLQTTNELRKTVKLLGGCQWGGSFNGYLLVELYIVQLSKN